jgi:uncharacterized protein YndB with AHSA1/START domain
MSRGERRLLHGSFTEERTIAAPVGRVFSAFSDLSLRSRWFSIPGKPPAAHHELDFRVGGGEVLRGMVAGVEAPEQVEYRSWFHDIVADKRIVYASELVLDGTRRSVSLVTVEMAASGEGTLLRYTEQYVFVALTGDGRDDVREREGGTRLQLNGLAAVVEGAREGDTQ